MNSEQRQLIRDLVQKFSGTGTEPLIAFVAETDGMMPACLALLQSIDAAGSSGTEWLQRECSESHVAFHAFLQEVTGIVALFQPSRNVEDHYTTLEISADAGIEEIKQAYRTLCRRYHPDTALPPYCDNPEKFIAINKAYHALLSGETPGEKHEYIHQGKQWRRQNYRGISPVQRKKFFNWALGLLMLLIVISTIASMNYKKKAMLAGLQENSGAFIPPAKKVSDISAGKRIKAEKQPTASPSLPKDLEGISSLDPVAKVLPEPEAHSVNLLLKELPQEEARQAIAAEASPGQAKPVVKQPSVVRQTRVKEKTKVNAIAAPSPALEVPVGKTSPASIANQFSGRQIEVRGNSEKIGEKSILLTAQTNNSSNAVAVTTENTVQLSTTLNNQVVAKEQTSTTESEDIFNTNKVASSVIISGGKPETKVHLSYATVTEVGSLPATPVQTEKHKVEIPDMQTRVDRFFVNYINAYEERNLMLFARFFDAEAEENGKPFTTILPTYLDLFSSTSHVAMQVEQRTWRTGDGKIAVDGRFNVRLEYKDGRTIKGSGPISFVLVNNDGELLIKKMTYVFHSK